MYTLESLNRSLRDPNTVAYIICETSAPSQVNILRRGTEKNGNKRGVVLETILQSADTVNRNKRYYSVKAINSGLEAPYIQERLRTFTWYGELSHPTKPDAARQMSYDMKNLSHIIEKYWWEGKILKGIVHSTFTSCGDDFAGLVEQGCQVAFSMRGIGPKVDKNGNITYVAPPLYIFTYDSVVHPSHPEAYMTKVINESSTINTSDNKETNLTSEDSIFELINKDKMIKTFISENSTNLKLISDMFELNEEMEVQVSGNKKFIVKDMKDGDKIRIKLEKGISKEIDNYLSKL